MIKKWDLFNQIVVTFFFSGKSKFAPGTMGSLATLPLVMLLYPMGVIGLFIGVLVSYFLGLYATNQILKNSTNKDPGFVVIDETAGQLTTFLFIAPFASLSLLNLGMGFALFRLFDIVKIWPCSYFDKKVVGAFGVMTDDVFAGIYAGLVLLCLNQFIF